MSDKVYEIKKNCNDKNNSNNEQKKWIEDKSTRYINPYNFVSFAEKCERSELKIDYKNSYTGVMECSLEVITPLIIPNTTCDMALHNKTELENEIKIRMERDGKLRETHSYDFFSYNDLSAREKNDSEIQKDVNNPVIPASEIRGTIRSVHEAAFSGCMSSVSSNKNFSRRSPESKNLGVLKICKRENEKKEEQWELYQCKRIRIKKGRGKQGELFISEQIYDDAVEGEKFYIEYKKKKIVNIIRAKDIKDELIANTESSMIKEAYLHKGEPFPERLTKNPRKKKKFETLFELIRPMKEKKGIPVTEEEISNLQKVVTEYKKGKEGSLHTGYKEYHIENLLKGDSNVVLPVYYYKGENLNKHMCPACIGKEVFYNTIGTILKKNGGFGPCENTKELCHTCKVFGMVPKENENKLAISSRIRFTDATLKEEETGDKNHFSKPVILPELGEPKPGTVEFYTISPYNNLNKEKKVDKQDKQCQYNYWTYDYYITTKDGKNLIRNPIFNGKLKLRGRKFYWHHNGYEEIIANNKEQRLTTMKQRVRPLACTEGNKNRFIFNVYFENLTEQELKELKWSIDFNDKKCAHKIGKAKPLGFGSVKIQIECVKFRTITATNGEWNLPKTKVDLQLPHKIVDNNQQIQDLKLIANLDHFLDGKEKEHFSQVAYPIGVGENIGKKNNEAGHQWFSGNRTMEKNDKRKFSFYKVLPTIQEELNKESNESKWLYKLEKK